MSGRILIRGGCVLTLSDQSSNLPRADVLIENGRIAEVGPGLRARDAEVIEASDAIIMPGFVDTHRHVWKSLFRHLGSTAIDLRAVQMDADDVYAATLVGLLSAAEAGITTVVDWADLPGDADLLDAALQAHADAGLRTVIVHQKSVPPETGPLTSAALASPDLTRANLDYVAEAWNGARGTGMRIHAHAGLAASDVGVVEQLAREGLLANDVTLVHCSHLSDEDIAAVASTGAAISLAPSSEMAGGLGAPPLQKFLDRRIQPGLAVDDEHLAPGDLFAQMRMANSVQHADYFDLKLAGKAGLPNLLTTRDVIRYATSVGARTAGLRDVTGSLDPGMWADIIVLRTDLPNIYPINDPIGAVVWGMDTSNVDWVLVGGRVLVRDGVLEGDVGRVRALAEAARQHVIGDAGPVAGVAAGETP